MKFRKTHLITEKLIGKATSTMMHACWVAKIQLMFIRKWHMVDHCLMKTLAVMVMYLGKIVERLALVQEPFYTKDAKLIECPCNANQLVNILSLHYKFRLTSSCYFSNPKKRACHLVDAICNVFQTTIEIGTICIIVFEKSQRAWCDA